MFYIFNNKILFYVNGVLCEVMWFYWIGVIIIYHGGNPDQKTLVGMGS